MEKSGVFLLLAVFASLVFGFTTVFAGDCGSPYHGKKGGNTTVNQGDMTVEQESTVSRVVIPPELINQQFPQFRNMDYITEENQLKIISAAIGYIPPFINGKLISKNKKAKLNENPFNWLNGIPLLRFLSRGPVYNWTFEEYWYEEIRDEDIPNGLWLLKGEKDYFTTIEDLLNNGYKPVYGVEVKGSAGVDLKALVYTAFEKVLNRAHTSYIALVVARVNSESYADGRNTGVSINMSSVAGTIGGVGGIGEGSSAGGEKRQFRLFVVGCREFEEGEDGYIVVSSPKPEEKEKEEVVEPAVKNKEPEKHEVTIRIEVVAPPVMEIKPVPEFKPIPAPEKKCELLPPFTVYFDFDKYEIKKEYLPKIDDYAKWLLEHPECKVQVEGHTCNIGSRRYNIWLGEERSDAVTDALIKAGGEQVRKQIVQSPSLGLTKPASEYKPENRRVIIRIVGPASGK